jgi:hypothetical protein
MVESIQNTQMNSKESYKAAFWFATGWALISIIVVIGFVRIGKAKSDLTADEKAIAHETE